MSNDRFKTMIALTALALFAFAYLAWAGYCMGSEHISFPIRVVAMVGGVVLLEEAWKSLPRLIGRLIGPWLKTTP